MKNKDADCSSFIYINYDHQMEFIGQNFLLYTMLKGEIQIISAKITSFHTYLVNYQLTIDVDIELLYDKERNLKLRFTDIKEYAFNYTINYHFYYIECYKLLLKDDLFYISFDPDQSSEDYAEIDNDVILCGSIEGFYI